MEQYIIDGVVSSVECYRQTFAAPSVQGHFTSFRLRRLDSGLRVLGWEKHYQRLQRDAQFMKTSVPAQAVLWRLLEEAVAGVENSLLNLGVLNLGVLDLRVRLDCANGQVGLCLKPLSQFLQGEYGSVRLQTLIAQRPHPSHKLYCGERESIRLQQQLSSGFDEVLLVDEGALIIEGAWSNFGWITPENKVRVTPFGLNGITQQLLIKWVEREPSLVFDGAHALLAHSEELRLSRPFVMSSVRGVVPVKSIDACEFDAPDRQLVALIDNYRSEMNSDELA